MTSRLARHPYTTVHTFRAETMEQATHAFVHSGLFNAWDREDIARGDEPLSYAAAHLGATITIELDRYDLIALTVEIPDRR